MMPIMTMVFNIVGLLGAYLLLDLLRAHRSRSVHRAVHLLDRSQGLHHRRDQGGRLRRDPLGGRLLPGVQRARRRQGGRPCHDAGGGCRLRLGSGVRLLPHRHLPHPLAVQVVNATAHPDIVDPPASTRCAAAELAQRDERWQIRVRGLHKSFRAAARPARRRPRHRARHDQHHHRRLGAGEVGADEAPHGAAQARTPGRSGSTARTSCRSSDQEMGKLRRKFGMVFQYAALFDSMNVVENIAFPLLERYHLPKRRDDGARARSAASGSIWRTSAASSRSSRPSCRAGSASASAWRGRSSTGRRSCSTTSRPPGSIRWRPRTSTR